MTPRPADEALEPRERPLTTAERRLLTAKERRLRSSSRSARALLLAAAVTAVLWLLTLLASDAPWPVVTVFWLVVGGTIALWAWWDAERDARYARAMADGLRSALEEDRAEVQDVRARGYVELEEYEDEGACYAFDLRDGRIVFVVGQPFYAAAGFPSLDFSLVHALDGEGRVVDAWIEKRGERVAPERVIPARTKWDLGVPEHLTILRGSLDELEDLLAARAGSRGRGREGG